MPILEDDETFLRRRMDEERQRSEEARCIVGAVHDDLSEEYAERLIAAQAQTAALAAILDRIS